VAEDVYAVRIDGDDDDVCALQRLHPILRGFRSGRVMSPVYDVLHGPARKIEPFRIDRAILQLENPPANYMV